MKNTLLLALAISAAPFAASAGELSYNSVEFGYAQNELDIHADKGDKSLQDMRPKGYYLKGSVELGASPFYLFGGYGQGNDTVTAHAGKERVRINAKQHAYEGGVGVHYGLNDKTDLLVETSYLSDRVTIDRKGVRKDVNDEAVRVAVGVEGLMTDSFEGWAKVNYTQGEMSSAEFGAELGAQYSFNKTWGLVGQYNYTRDTSGYQVGVRASF
jgi:hypothetical protein